MLQAHGILFYPHGLVECSASKNIYSIGDKVTNT